jgi:hypothetical protein
MSLSRKIRRKTRLLCSLFIADSSLHLGPSCLSVGNVNDERPRCPSCGERMEQTVPNEVLE